VCRENGIPAFSLFLSFSTRFIPFTIFDSSPLPTAHRWDINFYYGLFSFVPTRFLPRGGQQ